MSKESPASAELDPGALEAFEEILADWVAENLDALEMGGLGRVDLLAQRAKSWAAGER